MVWAIAENAIVIAAIYFRIDGYSLTRSENLYDDVPAEENEIFGC